MQEHYLFASFIEHFTVYTSSERRRCDVALGPLFTEVTLDKNLLYGLQTLLIKCAV